MYIYIYTHYSSFHLIFHYPYITLYNPQGSPQTKSRSCSNAGARWALPSYSMPRKRYLPRADLGHYRVEESPGSARRRHASLLRSFRKSSLLGSSSISVGKKQNNKGHFGKASKSCPLWITWPRGEQKRPTTTAFCGVSQRGALTWVARIHARRFLNERLCRIWIHIATALHDPYLLTSNACIRLSMMT